MRLDRRLLACGLLIFLGGCLAVGSGPARFTPQNSQEIVLSPYYLSDPSEGTDHAWRMKLKISDKIPVAGFLKPNQMLVESFTRWVAAQISAKDKTFTLSSTAPLTGCVGSYSGSIESQTRKDFAGNLNFAGYSDDCSLVIDGRVPFRGEINESGESVTVHLSLAELEGRLGVHELTLAGTIILQFNPFQGEKRLVTAEANMSLSDASGLRFRLAPVSFSWDRRGQFLNSIYEGQVIIPPYGRVKLVTLSPLRSSPGTHKPFNGSLRFEGADGSWLRLLYPNSVKPGFIRIDGSDGLRTFSYL